MKTWKLPNEHMYSILGGKGNSDNNENKWSHISRIDKLTIIIVLMPIDKWLVACMFVIDPQHASRLGLVKTFKYTYRRIDNFE